MVEYVLFGISGIIIGGVVVSWYNTIIRKRENEIREVHERIDGVFTSLNTISDHFVNEMNTREQQLRREMQDEFHKFEHILDEHANAINSTAEHVESIEPKVKGFSTK